MKVKMQTNKEGFKNSGKSVIDVLVSIDVEKNKKTKIKRTPLNISLVIDRSSSMAQSATQTQTRTQQYYGNGLLDNNGLLNSIFAESNLNNSKMSFAINAALNALDLMDDEDMVSIVTFDSQIKIVSEAILLKGNRAKLAESIKKINPRGSTNLHGGWVEGSKQIANNLNINSLNRVILLTDGETNIGKVDIDGICSDISALKGKHISTTTLGIGLHFNEELLQAIAESGEGNYYYVEDINQLNGLFAEEFKAISNLHGENVRLSVNSKPGVKILDCLNEFKKDQQKYILPNLIKGRTLEFMFSIEVDAKKINTEDLLTFEIEWQKEGVTTKEDMGLSLKSLSKEDYKKMPENDEVAAKKAILMASREKDKALKALRSGDYAKSQTFFASASVMLSSAPTMDCTNIAVAENTRAMTMLNDGKLEDLKKVTSYQNYNARTSKAK
jgi:Ca-activated chloride channel family protein